MNVVVRYGRIVCNFCTLLAQGFWCACSTDGGLSSIAVCSLHGCYGNNIHIVVFLVGSFTCGLFCGACLVLCFWASSGFRDGGRSPATAEAVSVRVGHGQNGSSGVRRRNRALSSPTDSEDSFDSRHAQHHRKDVRFSDRPLLDSHSRWRRVPRAPPSPASDRHNVAQREERTSPDDDDACWSSLGAGLRIRSSQAHVALSGSHRAGGSRAQETEDTCREGEGPGLAEALPPPATAGSTPDGKVDEGDSLDLGDTVADPLLDARVLSVQRNSAGDRHREFRNAVSELVQSPWAAWPASGPRTFLWCCKFMSEHALHPVAHHSIFVQLSGLLPAGSSAQEHGLGLTFDQLQGAGLSCFELLARRLQMLEMKVREKVAGSLFGGSIEEDSHMYLGSGRTRGLLMISPEREEFANETAAAKERRK